MSPSIGDIYLQMGKCMKSGEAAATASAENVHDLTTFRAILAQALQMPEYRELHPGFRQLFTMINMTLQERERVVANFEQRLGDSHFPGM